MGPLPQAALLKKRRKVRRAVMHKPGPVSQRARKDKVTCPECGTAMLQKSLERHMEMHSNWAEGDYNAHLYCRYCFAPYARMDLLTRHQKTDEQCVLCKPFVIVNSEVQPN